MKYTAYLALMAPIAEAKWGLGFCYHPPEVEDFDKERFEGSWYEIYRDVDHDLRSKEFCTVSTYYSTFNGMALEREYENMFGTKKYAGPFAIRERNFMSDGLPYAYHSNGKKYHHYVIDTDYEHYALVYGCDQYWGIFYGAYATLMSRADYIDSTYVTKAKNTLFDIGYDYNTNWV